MPSSRKKWQYAPPPTPSTTLTWGCWWPWCPHHRCQHFFFHFVKLFMAYPCTMINPNRSEQISFLYSFNNFLLGEKYNLWVEKERSAQICLRWDAAAPVLALMLPWPGAWLLRCEASLFRRKHLWLDVMFNISIRFNSYSCIRSKIWIIISLVKLWIKVLKNLIQCTAISFYYYFSST